MSEADKIYKALMERQSENAAQIAELTRAVQGLANANQQQVPASSVQQNPEMLADIISRSIEKFEPSPTSTFAQWYDKHAAIFTVDGAMLDDRAKVRLMLRKISQEAYDKYVSIILPSKPEQKTFEETANELKLLFSETKSLFQKRFDCLNVEKSGIEDVVSYGARQWRL